MSKSFNTILKGGGIVLAGLMFSKALMYLFRMIVARIGVEQYGLMSMGIVILELAVIVALIGMDMTVLRHISFYKGKKNLAKVKGIISFSTKTATISSIIVGALMFLFSGFLSTTVFHNEGLKPIIQMFAFTLPFYVLAKINFNILKSFQRIGLETFTKDVFKSSSRILLLILALSFGYGLLGAVFAYSLSLVLMFAVSYFFLKKYIHPLMAKLPKIKISKREMFLFSSPLMLSSILRVVMGYTDTLLIGNLMNMEQTGIYNAAMPTASSLMVLIPTAIFGLFIPVLSKHFAKKDYKTFRSLYNKSMLTIIAINVPVAACLVMFSPKIISIMFGAEYVSGATALSILTIGYLIYSIFFLSDKLLLIFKKTKLILINSAIVFVVNFGLNFYLISNYGINGAAVATSISLLLYGLLSFFQANYYLRQLLEKAVPKKEVGYYE